MEYQIYQEEENGEETRYKQSRRRNMGK